MPPSGFPIKDYDGRTIPLPDASVDVVFSSNVLEHVPDLSRMHAEIRRVLAPGGICIHVVPTHTWRLWTTLTSYLEAISFSCRRCRRLVPRAVPTRGRAADDCGRPGTGPPGTRPVSVFRGGTASAATSSRSCGCSIPAGGGEISRTTALPSSPMGRWGCSIPAKCCWDCASALPSASAWRACSAVPATSSSLCRCRSAPHVTPLDGAHANSRAISCAGRSATSWVRMSSVLRTMASRP